MESKNVKLFYKVGHTVVVTITEVKCKTVLQTQLDTQLLSQLWNYLCDINFKLFYQL